MMYFDGYVNPHANKVSPKPWKECYAWFPKEVNGKLVWLKHYYKRLRWTEYKAGDGYTDHEWRWQYGDFADVMRSD
jgi:hypothetical protein